MNAKRRAALLWPLMYCLTSALIVTASVVAGSNRPTEPDVGIGTNRAGISIVVNTSSNRSILAMCGRHDYVDPLTGKTHRGAIWKYNFVGPFIELDDALGPGEVYEFVPAPHPERSDLKLYQINVTVTAVLLSDGTALGEQAEFIREKVLGTARDARVQLMEIRDAFKQGDFARNEKALKKYTPIVHTGRMPMYVHLKLRQHLLSDGLYATLRADYMERLDKLIAYLGRF